MSLAGTVVTSWTLTQGVAGWQVRPFYCNGQIFFVTEFSEFCETFRKKANEIWVFVSLV